MSPAIAQVAVPAPLLRFFDYEIPAELQGKVQPGMRVEVPFGRQKKIGVVIELLDKTEFKTKTITAVLDDEILIPEKLRELILWGARHYLTAPGEAFRAVLPAPFWKPTKRRHKIKPPRAPELFEPKQITYTDAQHEAIKTIWESAASEEPETFLLHGVTGSGKTEVYLELARRALDQKRSVLILVPEISLTPQMLGRCTAELPESVGIYHSGLTARQRQEVWEQCQAGELNVVVGTRSALFLPLHDLQLIVVDEEHDASYKQEERFRYNARDLAIVRGQLESATVILGSATPSLESLQRCREDKYHYLQLPERAGSGALPELCFVDLAQQESASLLSDDLATALDQTLQQGEQSILFLNRRGFSPVQLCKDCGECLQCPDCHITLTLHKKRGHLLCHYCLREQKESAHCLSCGSSRVVWVGFGTERVESELAERFPRARIARLDRDTVAKKGVLEDSLAAMRRGEIDILLGTQILTKGHDYSNVTLVGVLLAESSLNFPDFRAGERTFQMITQVAGRAGRGDRPGRVIIQGFQPQHYVMKAALSHDYAGLADRELKQRSELRYPPLRRLIQMVWRSTRSELAEAAAAEAAAALHRSLGSLAEVMGPAPSPIEKLRSQYRWQVLIKTDAYGQVRPRLQASLDGDLRNSLPSNVILTVDVDPVNML